MKPIIEIKDLSKKFIIRGTQSYYSLRDSIMNTVKNPLNLFQNTEKEELWALKDVSFSVEQGEVIGIIGKNGAGKSTLLKILSQITPPTKGEVVLRGRVASLLEVGTGFHPELTGHENIYLNGTILGMTRSEINKKYDDIVGFAEIEKFLDTPVKHYSSGMYTRLAFAVAAHLDPEILIVDEVLAVGDASFQKKSLGKMRDISKKGRTVLFVSHNMSAISSLCQKAILLDLGKVVKTGRSEEVVNYYLHSSSQLEPTIYSKETLPYTKDFKVLQIRIIDNDNKVNQSFDITKDIIIEIIYQIKKPLAIACNIQVFNSDGIILFNSPQDSSEKWKEFRKKPSQYRVTCTIPGNFMAEGLFSTRISCVIFDKQEYEIDFPDGYTFTVFDKLKGDSVRGVSVRGFPGVVRPKLKWEFSSLTLDK